APPGRPEPHHLGDMSAGQATLELGVECVCAGFEPPGFRRTLRQGAVETALLQQRFEGRAGMWSRHDFRLLFARHAADYQRRNKSATRLGPLGGTSAYLEPGART